MPAEDAHVAVLCCDSPFVELAAYGDLGDLCVQLLQRSGCKFPARKYVVFHKSDDPLKDEKSLSDVYLELLDGLERGSVKGIMISGSVSDSFAEDLWIKRLDEFLRLSVFSLNRFPITGVCFGHQIIAKNLGCKVGRNLPEVGWECGTTTITLNPEIFTIEEAQYWKQEYFTKDGQLADHLNLSEIHQDIVYGLPPPSSSNSVLKDTSFMSIGESGKCSIQGLITKSGSLKILTFQGHPEFTTEFTLDLLKDIYEKGHLEKSIYEKAVYNTKILNNQGDVIGKIIGEFINHLNSDRD